MLSIWTSLKVCCLIKSFQKQSVVDVLKSVCMEERVKGTQLKKIFFSNFMILSY